MAKPEDKPSTHPAAPAEEKAAGPPPTVDELRKQVVKPAKKSTRAHAPQIDPSLAGTYRVKHGTIHFGQGVTAEKGAIVQLSAHDAHHMLAVGTIAKLDDDDFDDSAQ